MRKHKDTESKILYDKYKLVLVYYYRDYPEEIKYVD